MGKRGKRKKPEYEQGYFKPQNREKYTGTFPIRILSRYEKDVMMYLDRNPNCVEWSSESIAVRYKDPNTNKNRRYFPDIYCVFKTSDGSYKKYLIEIKPYNQVRKPVKKNNSYERRLSEYSRNVAKWEQARLYSQSIGAQFIILTEREIYRNNNKNKK